MYGRESWTIKKIERWRIDAYELRCWRRLLRVPCTARRSNQSILKEINSEYSPEGLMLKLQYFGHLMWRAGSLERPWCWERLRTGGEGNDRGWDGWVASPTQWTWVWASSGRWKDREAACAAAYWVAKNQTQLSDWTIAMTYCLAHGTLLNVMWQPGWEGSLGKNGYVYMNGWVP